MGKDRETDLILPTIIFEKTLTEVGSLHLYASFGTFYVQIGQLFEAQWVFEKCLKRSNRCFRRKISQISDSSENVAYFYDIFP